MGRDVRDHVRDGYRAVGGGGDRISLVQAEQDQQCQLK